MTTTILPWRASVLDKSFQPRMLLLLQPLCCQLEPSWPGLVLVEG